METYHLGQGREHEGLTLGERGAKSPGDTHTQLPLRGLMTFLCFDFLLCVLDPLEV